MGLAIPVDLGGPAPLSLTSHTGTSGLFPQATVRDSALAQVAGSPFDLPEIGATAQYTSYAWTPLAAGTYTAQYIAYTDAGHTTESATDGRDQDEFYVTAVADACHLVVAFGETTDDLRIKAWLDRGGTTVVAPTAITLTWYNTDGLVLFTLVAGDAIPAQNPDAQGVYAFQRTQVLADDVTYYVEIAITDATGVVTTKRAVETIA